MESRSHGVMDRKNPRNKIRKSEMPMPIYIFWSQTKILEMLKAAILLDLIFNNVYSIVNYFKLSDLI